MTNAELIEYYKNLLILQYKTLTKAPAHIEALIEIIMIFELIEDVKNAYDIDTAVGVQLDVLGKYIGLDRQTIIAIDADYRTYLKFRIIQNSINYSAKEIDDLLFDFFGTSVYLADNQDMSIFYTFIDVALDLIQFLVDNKLLPKPAAVELNVIAATDDPFVFHDDPDGSGFGRLLDDVLQVDPGTGVETLEVDPGTGVEDLDILLNEIDDSSVGGEISALIL